MKLVTSSRFQIQTFSVLHRKTPVPPCSSPFSPCSIPLEHGETRWNKVEQGWEKVEQGWNKPATDLVLQLPIYGMEHGQNGLERGETG